MHITKFDFADRTLRVTGRAIVHPAPSGEKSSLLLVERPRPPKIVKGVSSIFLSELITWFDFNHRVFPYIPGDPYFELGGLWGPEYTKCQCGLCIWKDHKGRFYAVIVYTKVQAIAVIESMRDCTRSSVKVPSYRKQAEKWNLPDASENHSFFIDGERAELLHHASMAWHLQVVFTETLKYAFEI